MCKHFFQAHFTRISSCLPACSRCDTVTDMLTIYFLVCIGVCRSLSDIPGDGKPFGYNDRPTEHIPIEAHDISPKDFFQKYVFEQKAVMLKGAVKNSPAVEKWSDNYFLNIPNEKIPENHEVHVESRKKENRTAPTVDLPFKIFVEIYNKTDQYMVESVPSFLKSDIHLPFAIQCEETLKSAVDTVMWFSSGGTKSVVHTDSVENLNCLFRGEKKFVFVPPQFREKVTFDHPEGSYSGIDVDAVDYLKYPGLAEVEYQYVDMVAGDCVYIPFKWIHQVRSYNRNIAVNLWWDTSSNNDLDLDGCNEVYDENLTLENVELQGFGSIDFSQAIIKDLLTEQTSESKEVTKADFLFDMMSSIFDDISSYKKEYFQFPSMEFLKKAFALIDKTNDGKISRQDLEALDNDGWTVVIKHLHKFKEVAEDEAETLYGDEDEEAADTPEIPAEENHSTENIKSEKDEL